MTRLLLPLLACAPVLLHGQINSISETWTVNSVGSIAANTLVQRDASNPTLVQAVASASGSFPDVLGIALSTATSGQPVQVARYGQAPCVLDSNSTAGHLAVVGSTTYSYCGDGGLPINGVPLASRVVGYFLQTQTAGSGNTALVELTPGLMGTALTSVPIISTTGSISAGSTGSAGCVNLFDLSGTQTQLCSPTMATGDLLVNGTALVLSGGALGTPSSGTLTNATGYPLSSLANPTAGAAFTFPASTSANLSINGTAPGTASSGTGEGDILDLTAGGGGACTGANCSGGAGGGSTFVHGNGGSSAPASGSGSSAGGGGGGFSVATGVGGAAAGNGTTPGIGGVGGAVTLTSGAGGAGTANSSTGGVGGAVAITAGAGGAGGTTNGNGGAGGAVTIGSGASGTPIGSGTGGAKGALTFQQAGSTVANWGSLGGLLLESGAATQGVTIIGGRDTSGNEALGGAVLRGANQTGTGGSTSVAGSVLMEGGTNAATNTSSQAGSVEVLAGASNSSTIGLPGLLVLAATYVRGATSTQWNLQCESASMTVVDCGASVVNWIGVAESVGATSGTTSVQVCVVGSQCPINSGNTAVLGHTVCVGGSLHPAEVLDSGGSSACTPAGSTVGVVMAVTGAWTLPDGTSFTASSSLPLVQLVHF